MIIGLTGGIATGKSTVSDYLRDKYQIPVIDADVLAREAVQVGSPIFERIVERYGDDILNPDGDINRGRLGEIVFGDEGERLWLEGLVHPYVRARMEEGIRESDAPIILLSIPLLFEAKMTDLVDQIWVVYTDFETQVSRLQQRNGFSRQGAIARIRSQMPLQDKLVRADVVIDNSGSVEELYRLIKQIKLEA
ncbi:dephospho-CoA kinase [Cyanobacterium stanieri PCC 7202]|uniref:Dephospho-CoA kinase n=1 Tax=Cyanobacterium stanieri (strain ATCC 29140 / PCC 7202) TaxID=292563 RepID=K9YRU7_CYASC|nr:dephospho-CoA kinase [Cyanobacterium stanieri PCC 7202]